MRNATAFDAGAGGVIIDWRCEPLTPATWPALERLFGSRGACGGCWCMWHRLPRREYDRLRGEGTRRKLLELVERGEPVGVIAFDGEAPIAWCSIAPAEQYRSRIVLPEDHAATGGWWIRCLFVDSRRRRQGISTRIIREAVGWAASRGARSVVASAVIPRKAAVPPVFAFHGLLSAYTAAGFTVIARTSGTRATVLYDLVDR